MVKFKDVSRESGLQANKVRTFPTWFWDYDNDGWLDLLICGYEFNGSLAPYFAAEALNIPRDNSGVVFLYRNKHDGTFEDMTEKVCFEQVCLCNGVKFWRYRQ
jgi:hypothetical protein